MRASITRRQARRAHRRRRAYRRRRAAALVAVVAVGAGAYALVSSISGGGGANPGDRRSGGEHAGSAAPRAATGRGVNARPEAPSRNPVPILMYHVISTAQPWAQDPELYVNQGNLEREMRWLADHGFSGVTLDRVYDAWFKGGNLPRKPVVVSFDDGYRSQYTDGLPVMQKLGWPGVLNLKVDALAQHELSQDQVRTMIDDGWEVDSHTISHADVTQIFGSDLTREVAGSRRILQRRFGIPVDFFCYPAGRYDAAAERAVEDAGYLGATTTVEGLADRHEIYTLKRIRVNASDGVKGLAAKLRELGA
jgi:peptidoglycan/xylan/chitin deacetylase (PgdA/CDA1 family)